MTALGEEIAERLGDTGQFEPCALTFTDETEAFTQRVMARIPERAAGWWPARWLTPSLAFSAAALALSLALPAADEEPADVVGSWVAAAPAAEDLYGLALEDR